MSIEEAKVRKESGQVEAKRIALIIAGWFLFVLVGLAVLLRVNQAVHVGSLPQASAFPVPRLITKPYAQFAPYLHAQKQMLDGMAREKGQKAAAMPIAQSMTELLKRRDPYAPLGDRSETGRQ